MKKALLLAVLLGGCSVATTVPTGTLAVEGEGRARTMTPACTANWLQLAEPGQFAYQPGPWGALLVGAAHGYEIMELSAWADNGATVMFAHSYQPEGVALLLSVSDERPTTVTAWASRPWMPDCSRVVVRFPTPF